MKASMARDLDRGNRLELDWLAGKVRELGRALNVPTPASDAVYTVLKLHRSACKRWPSAGRMRGCRYPCRKWTR